MFLLSVNKYLDSHAFQLLKKNAFLSLIVNNNYFSNLRAIFVRNCRAYVKKLSFSVRVCGANCKQLSYYSRVNHPLSV